MMSLQNVPVKDLTSLCSLSVSNVISQLFLMFGASLPILPLMAKSHL